MIIVKNRELLIPGPERYIGTTYDTESENRQFLLARFAQNGVDLSALTFRLDLKYANDATDTVVLDKEVTDTNIILTWNIGSSVLHVPGTLFIQIRAVDDEVTVKWSSFHAAIYVERHLNTPGNYTGSLTEIEQIEQDHQYMKGVVDELKSHLDYTHEAEAWAIGKKDGEDVPSTDETYHNNSKYYSEQANTKATQAANSATAAANSATQAAETVADTNTRFNNAMAGVTSETEVIDARVGADGTAYPVLKTRLDTEHNQLKNAINKIAVASKNLFDKSDITTGKYQPTNAAYLITSAGWNASAFIPVEAGKTYTGTNMGLAAYFNSSGGYVGTPSPNNSFTVPENVATLRVSVRDAWLDTFMLNEGTELLPYEEYGGMSLNKEAISDEFEQEIIDRAEQADTIFLHGRESNNLFDKTKVTPGKYQQTNAGFLLNGAGWNASEFIPVEAGKTYSATSMNLSAFFTSANNEGFHSGGNKSNTFTVPAGVAFVRVSVRDENLDTFMLNEGQELLPHEYATKQIKTESVPPDVIKYIGFATNKNDAYKDILPESLFDAFKPTKIKLLGDSITAGVGGTGYSPTGETMKGGEKANVLTATCWSNMFYDYINSRFNKVVNVPFSDSKIVKASVSEQVKRFTWTITEDGFQTQMNSWGVQESNAVADVTFGKFDFYGTGFSVSVVTGDYGIFTIVVDGNISKTVDCYSANETYAVEETVNGLESGKHTVEFVTTAQKNESATTNKVILLYVAIPKTAEVKPWGLSGETSFASSFRLEADDDIVILEYGTNDRHTCISPEVTYKNLANTIDTVLSNGGVPIVMCAPPTSIEETTRYPRRFQMWDVRDVLQLLAKNYGLPFVDNYTAFINYCETHGVSVDSLLADGLHPNDLGYNVMFENILKTLGLSLIISA